MVEKTRFIHRASKDEDHPYFMLSRAVAQDCNLSFEARGVLIYILSKPDHWRVQVKDLQQNCGKSVVYRILGELMKHGYINRTQTRDENNKIISWDYAVHENPLPKNQEVAFQEVEKQELENRSLRVLESIENTENKNSAPIGTEAQSEPVTIPVVIDVLAQANKVIEDLPEKKPRKPNPNFDAVCEYIFEVDPLSVGQEGGRIGPIAAWLNGKSEGLKRTGGKVGFISRPAEPEHVKLFANWYKTEYPDANLPYDFNKFVDAWRKWATVMAKRAAVKSKLPTPVTQMPELTQAQRDELAVALQTVRPDWEKAGVQ